MTSPGGRAGITPGPLQDAVSIDGVNGNIPALSGLDQPTAEALLKELYIKDNPKIEQPQADIYAGIREGTAYALSIIESLVNAIIGAPSGNMFLNIGHANSIVNLFIGGITTQVTEHTAAIANLEEVTAAMNTTQAYVGDLQDMVTVPRFGLVTIGPVINKSVDINVGFTAADFSFGWVMPVFKPFNTLFTSRGSIYYTPIVVDRKGIIDRIRWIVGADTAIFSVDFYEMALCVYNPANGNIEKVWSSGNIKDTTANTTALGEVEISMGLDQECTPGQVLFVAHQQTASGLLQETRTFAAVPGGKVGRGTHLLLDAWCYSVVDFSQGIPSSIPLESLAKENRFIPWSAVTANAIVP